MAKTAPFTGFFCRFCHFFSFFVPLFGARSSRTLSATQKGTPKRVPLPQSEQKGCRLCPFKCEDEGVYSIVNDRNPSQEERAQDAPLSSLWERQQVFADTPEGSPRQGIGLRPRTNDARFVFFLFFLPSQRAWFSSFSATQKGTRKRVPYAW